MAARASAQAPFSRIGIVGLGLIGGSIAHAVRARCPGVSIAGVDRPAVAERARALGLVNEVRAGVEALGDVGLLVFATPVPAILELLGRVPRDFAGIVTDVGSTKRRIAEAARRAGVRRFVGGHPMAGRERSGLESASPELFDGRLWFLLDDGQSIDARGRVADFVQRLGATPQSIDAAAHDRSMAYVSHLPQWVSTTLMARVGDAVGPDGLGRAGRGLIDMTRLAESPSDVWTGIFATNADFIAEAASALAADLAGARAALTDESAIDARFTAAHRYRAMLPGSSR